MDSRRAARGCAGLQRALWSGAVAADLCRGHCDVYVYPDRDTHRYLNRDTRAHIHIYSHPYSHSYRDRYRDARSR